MSSTFEQLHGYYIEDLRHGMQAVVSKTFTQEDVEVYARLSTDTNPLHLDESFASRTRAGGRVLHGMVTASLISAVIGTRLPGPGCLYVKQEMRFLAPVHVGEEVHASAEIVDLEPGRHRARMSTLCTVAERPVLEGEALLWVPSRAKQV